MTKISVILATFNEEKNIRACLESVNPPTGGLADEIIVVDGTSSDRTAAIAKRLGAKVFVRENPLMFHKNKQLAIEKATSDWILYLDADERVTPDLREELRNVIRDTRYDGFWIPRKNIIFGKWIEHTGWWPDYQLRFFKKGQARLPCKNVHEQPELKGTAGYLKQPLVHYNYTSVAQFIQKLNSLYTENDKNVFLASGKKPIWQDAIRMPTAEFIKRFFAEEGYRDGPHGLILSLLQSFSALVTFAKIWEVNGFQTAGGQTLNQTEGEFHRLGHDLHYWWLTVKIRQSTSSLKKVYLRLRRKLL